MILYYIILYYIISGIQVHVSAYIKVIIRLRSIYRKYKFNNSQILVYF